MTMTSRIAWAVVLGMALASPWAAAAEPFSFIQLCDTQLGMGGYEKDKQSFQLAVEQINTSKPDLVFICGDLINQTNDDQAFADFNAIKAGFSMPCHCAAGNHDIGNETTPELLDRYIKTIGKDYYEVEHKGFTFLVTNTTLWKSPLPGKSEAHDAWFQDALTKASAAQRPVIVISHYAPMLKSQDEKEEYFNLPKAKRNELLTLAKKHGAIAWLSGHTHKHNETSYNGMPIVAANTSSKNFDGAPRGYRIWHIAQDGALTHEYIPIQGAPPNPSGK